MKTLVTAERDDYVRHGTPAGVKIALVTADVSALYSRAVKAGAISVREPATMPWGQTVGYLRDNAGHLVELCTPVAK